MRNTLGKDLTILGCSLDPDTFSHSLRVGMLARFMAQAIGMPEDDERRFTLACCYHDVGKSLIPASILTKRQSLDPDERQYVWKHPLLGVELVRKLGWQDERMFATIRSHHEKWDGTGYPDGLSGERIPVWARICAVADAFDAMVQPRPYKRMMSVSEARKELRRQRNAQFDRTYVDLFLELQQDDVQSSLFLPHPNHKAGLRL